VDTIAVTSRQYIATIKSQQDIISARTKMFGIKPLKVRGSPDPIF